MCYYLSIFTFLSAESTPKSWWKVYFLEGDEKFIYGSISLYCISDLKNSLVDLASGDYRIRNFPKNECWIKLYANFQIMWDNWLIGYRSFERFSFFNLFILFIYYFWLCWVFLAACGLSLVAASGGCSSLWCAGFSLRWLLLLRSMGSRCVGFSVAHEL